MKIIMKRLLIIFYILFSLVSFGQNNQWVSRVDAKDNGCFDPRDLLPRNRLIIHLVYSFENDTVRIGVYNRNSEQDSVVYYGVVSKASKTSSFLPTEQIVIKNIRKYHFITLQINNSPTLQIRIIPAKHYMLVYFYKNTEIPDPGKSCCDTSFIDISYRKYCPSYD